MSNKYGFGLLETFISMCIVSIILITLINNYFLLKTQVKKSRDSLNHFEQMIMTYDLLKQSVRKAGFAPCINIEQLVTYDHRFNNHLTAISFVNSQQAFIKINRMSEDFATAKKIGANAFLLDTNIKLDVKYPVIIADCFHAEVQNLSNIIYSSEGIKVVLKNPLKFHYQSPSYIGMWLDEKFFIQKSLNNNPALFFESLKRVDELSNEISHLYIEKLSRNLFHFILDSKTSELSFDVAARCL